MLRTKPYRPRRSGHSYVVSLLIIAVFAAVALLLIANRQYVVDQVAVWRYQPSSEITSLAMRSGMGDTGEFYFYASHPSVEDASAFNKACGNTETSTAILGCYNGQNIYIYNVTDAKLDGIKEVTAAHEMLHAAYIRLDTTTKKQVDALLEAEYQKLKTNKDFAERMAFYAKTEPGERDNELHSLIGTEVLDISAKLEAYYKRYFADRSKVVALHDKYMGIFNELQAKSQTLSEQLTVLGAKINQEIKDYDAAIGVLKADIVAFQKTTFSSYEEAKAEQTALQTRSDELNQKRSSIQAEIQQYNQLRDELQSVAAQSQALNRSIDSSLKQAPSL